MDKAYLFRVFDNRLLPSADGEPYHWIRPSDVDSGNTNPCWYVGEHQGVPAYVEALTTAETATGQSFRSLRDWVEQLSGDMFMFAGRALQLAHFYQTHQYCGCCGKPLSFDTTEHFAFCKGCNLRFYPRVSPCVIVLVRKLDKLLLVQTHRHQGRLHSIVAGFVEPGETLEQAAEREVLEEAGVRINNLRYVASQPWPFPHSLMAGYIADWESGEITPQLDEIAHADWFSIDDLPILAPPGTIARQVIDQVTQEIAAESK